MLDYCYINQAFKSGYEIKNGSDNFVSLVGDDTDRVNNFNFYSAYKKYKLEHSDLVLDFIGPDELAGNPNFLVKAQEIFPDYTKNSSWSDYFDLYIVVKYASYNVQVLSPNRYVDLALYMFFCPKGSRMGVSVKDDTYSVFDKSAYYYVRSNAAYISCRQTLTCYQPNQPTAYADKYKFQLLSPVFAVNNLDSMNFYVNWGNPSELNAGDRCEIYYTNMPVFLYEGNGIQSYIDTGDDTGVLNKTSEDDAKIGCDSFGWDTCDCYLVENGTNYRVFHEYTYSNEDMKKNANDYVVVCTYTVDTRYLNKKGVAKTFSDSGSESYLLSDYSSSYTSKLSFPVFYSFQDEADWIEAFGNFFDVIVGFWGHVDTNFSVEEIIEVKSLSLYVTVKLYKGSSDYANYFDGLSNPDTHFDLSSDVKIFKFDLMSGSIYPSEVTPTVNTEEVKDDNGNVTDKKVTSVVGNDDGRTVVNITIDNGHEINNTNTNTNTGGSGSGSGSDAEDVMSFWDIVSKLGDILKGLFTGSVGLFAAIKAFFDFIPAAFWTVVIAIVVIIGIIAIFKLVKSVIT